MQPFNYPGTGPGPGNLIQAAPASSKALIKLKTDKLIPSREVSFQSGQPLVNYQMAPNFGKPQIRFTGTGNQGGFASHTSSTPSMPMVPLQRQGSNNSMLSSSQSFHQSELGQSAINPLSISQSNNQYALSQSQQSQSQFGQQSQMNPTFYGGPGGRNEQPVKPLSAFLKTNHISTNGDASRVRSSSASQFSFNNNAESERRVAHLEGKLKDYNEQILQSNSKLVEKEKRVTELETELYGLRQKSSDLQLKLHEIEEGDAYKSKRLAQLETENKSLLTLKARLENKADQSEQKVKSLESSLDKILKSKNIEIESLNQSCKQLSKHVELLQQKYEQEVAKLSKTIEIHQNTIKKNEIYFGSLNERVKSYEEQQSSQELETQQYSKKINEQSGHIETLENENKTLKTDLSAHIEQLEALQKKYEIEKGENAGFKAEIQRLTADFGNAKKIGEQQIQFLQVKVQEGALEKERLLEEIELTKAVTIKRNMVFERQIIYELKQENDRLWAKLIQKSESNANAFENSPQYWNRKYSGPSSDRSSIPNPQPYYQEEIRPNSRQNTLQNQYRMFVERLEEEQNRAQSRITELSGKESKNNEEDVAFYRNKCINLEKMVEEHLEINLSLKQQLEKQRATNLNLNPSNAEITILKSELEKQELLNQTLNRSFELFKSEYELKFKAAQKKVDEIQNESKRKQTEDPNLVIIEFLKKNIAEMQSQIRNLTIENSNMNIKISESNRWQSLYFDLKKKNEEMSPISHFKYQKQKEEKQKQMESDLKQAQNRNESLQREVEMLKKMYKDKENEIANMVTYYEQRCEGYDQQLKAKENDFVMICRDFEKVERQFVNGKARYEQLIEDIIKLEKELEYYKSGSPPVKDRTQAIYFLSLVKSKLLQIQAFIKEVLEIHNNSRKAEQKLSADNLNLIKNGEAKIENCLALWPQLETVLELG